MAAYVSTALLAAGIPLGALIACIVAACAVVIGVVILVVVMKKRSAKKSASVPAKPASAKPAEKPVARPAPAPVKAPEKASEKAETSAPAAPVAPAAPAKAEPAPAAEPVPTPAPAPKAEVSEGVAVVTASPNRLVEVQYDKSYLARLIQADETTKRYYCDLKAEILAYGVKSRISWGHEAFRAGTVAVKMKMRGKTLCLFFALDPAAYADTKYKVEDMSETAAYEQTPCLYRIVNDRRARYALDLIAAVMTAAGKTRAEETPSLEAPPYESTEKLLKRGLIRLIETANAEPSPELPHLASVRVEETKVLGDEIAAAHVEKSVRYADKTKTGIINVDTLSQYFKDGETVTLAEIQKRIGGYKKVTYIKVLARGALDKALTVEADEFSIEAVKMILLTGGKVVRTLRRGE